jgi:hypothetical protein
LVALIKMPAVAKLCPSQHDKYDGGKFASVPEDLIVLTIA